MKDDSAVLDTLSLPDCCRSSWHARSQAGLRRVRRENNTVFRLGGNERRREHRRSRSQRRVGGLIKNVATQAGRASTAIPKSGMGAVRLDFVCDIVGNDRWPAGIGI